MPENFHSIGDRGFLLVLIAFLLILITFLLVLISFSLLFITSIFMFLVESAEKPDRPFRTGNLETLDWHWLGIPHSPNGAKKARKKTVFS